MRRYLKDEDIAAALREGKGFYAEAARRLGVTRQAVAKRVHASATLSAVEAECVDTNLDTAESRLIAAIEDGAGWAIKFFLQCKGKERGYHFPNAVPVEEEPPPVVRPLEEIERDLAGLGFVPKGKGVADA